MYDWYLPRWKRGRPCVNWEGLIMGLVGIAALLLVTGCATEAQFRQLQEVVSRLANQVEFAIAQPSDARNNAQAGAAVESGQDAAAGHWAQANAYNGPSAVGDCSFDPVDADTNGTPGATTRIKLKSGTEIVTNAKYVQVVDQTISSGPTTQSKADQTSGGAQSPNATSAQSPQSGSTITPSNSAPQNASQPGQQDTRQDVRPDVSASAAVALPGGAARSNAATSREGAATVEDSGAQTASATRMTPEQATKRIEALQSLLGAGQLTPEQAAAARAELAKLLGLPPADAGTNGTGD